MQNKNKSIETMKGVLLSYKEGYQNEKKDYSLTILIDDPFNAKISIEIDNDEWNKYVNYHIDHKWKGILDSHPENCNSLDSYFNIQEHEFYMASTIDDKGNPIWQKSTLEKIVYASYRAMSFNRHIRTDYNRYHVGQHCKFSAYAIDDNENFYKPSSIKKDFHEYQWIFYPTTFTAHEITSDSIEHLIAKTPPPKLVADKIILDHIQEYQHSKTNGLNIDGLVAEIPPSESATLEILQNYKAERKQSQKKARQQWKLKVKTTFSNLWERFTKQETPISIVWKGTAIISSIIAIWALFFKNK